MNRNFFKLSFILLQLSSVLAYISPDGLSNAIGHYDMAQAIISPVINAEYACHDPRRESAILAIRELRASQGYGDPLYKKFYDLSIVRFYGALNLSVHMQTRQDIISPVIGSYLFPAQYLADLKQRDINAHGKTLIKAELSRIGVFFNPFTGMTEKDIYGILELDFTGISLITQYTAKLRHAFGEIVWNSGAFLFGQYYHPLFLKECFPRTVDFNMGAPFDPQGLTPQLRLSQRFGQAELIVALTGEAYMQTFGPVDSFNGIAPDFLQNGIVPNFNFQAKWIRGNSFYGGAIDYKRIVPRLSVLDTLKVNEYLNSLIGEVYAHNVFWWGELNLKVIYSENGSDQLLISGFAVKTQNPTTKRQTYVNTAALSGWLDVFRVFFNRELYVGIFAGIAKNLGAHSSLFLDPITNQPIVFALNGIAQNILYVARVSPRLVFVRDAFRFGFECSWNSASYGSLNNCAQVINARVVNAFSYTVSLDYVF